MMHYLVSGNWSVGASGILMEIAAAPGCPGFQNRLNDRPPTLDHLSALEQTGVANHCIVQKGLVSCAVLNAKIVAVIERHVHRARLDDRPWNLSLEFKRDVLLWLNGHDQPIWLGERRSTSPEQG